MSGDSATNKTAEPVDLGRLPDDPDIRAALAAEAARLLGIIENRTLPPTVAGGHDHVFGGEARHLAAVSDLAPARQAIKSAKGRYPLANLLVHPPAPFEPRAHALDLLRAWVLAALLDAVGQGLREHTTGVFAARAVSRLCRRGELDAARARVPDFDVPDADAAHDVAVDWQADEAATGSPFSDRIECIRIVIGQLAGLSRTVLGPVSRRRRRRSQAHIDATRCWVRVPARNSLELLCDCAEFDLDHSVLESVEEAGDIAEPVAIRRIGTRDEAFAGEAADAAELLWAQDELFDLSGAALASAHRPTPSEARAIYAELRAHLASFDLDEVNTGTVLLAVSLLTGRSLRDLLAVSRSVPKVPGRSWWVYEHGGVAGIAFCPAVSGASKPPANGIVLALPTWLRLRVDARLHAEEAFDEQRVMEQARAWLRSRNFAGRSPRLSRVAGALPAALEASDTDAAIGALLLGSDIRVVPQLWYSRVPIERLNQAWRGLLEDFIGETGKEVRVVRSAHGAAIGSRGVPSDEQVHAFFQARKTALAEAITASNWRGRPGGVERVHKAVIDQCAAILIAATGRRPHGPLWAPLRDTLTIGPHPMTRIVDKGNRLVDDARWLPLPPVALEALEALFTHLGHLRDWGRVMNQAVARAADASLAGEVCPFWYIDEDGADPRPLSGADWWDGMPTKTLRRNMFRHYWRTRFLTERLPGGLIDTWMGHGGWQGAQFLPMAADSIGDLMPIREHIEARLRALGAAAPTSRRLLR